ncbi:hypothetical protein DXG03_003972, partial [Asterophora parasitica]
MKKFPFLKKRTSYSVLEEGEKTVTCKPADATNGHQPHPPVHELVTNTFVFALSLVEKISECAPVPGLKGAVGALTLTIQRFEDSGQNLKDFDELVSSIDKLNNILSMFEAMSATGRDLTDDLGEQLFNLSG